MTIAYSRNRLIRSVPKNPRVLDTHEVRTKFASAGFVRLGKSTMRVKTIAARRVFSSPHGHTDVDTDLYFVGVDTLKIVQRCTAFLAGM